MGKSELHSDLQFCAERYLRNKQYWICGQEVPMPMGICDAWGMTSNNGYPQNETMAIEVKVSRSDHRSKSQQYKENNPRPLGNYQYILCPKDLIRPEEIHEEWGLLWYDEEKDRIYNKKKAPFLEMTAEQKLEVLIFFLDNGINEKRPKIKQLNQ